MKEESPIIQDITSVYYDFDGCKLTALPIKRQSTAEKWVYRRPLTVLLDNQEDKTHFYYLKLYDPTTLRYHYLIRSDADLSQVKSLDLTLVRGFLHFQQGEFILDCALPKDCVVTLPHPLKDQHWSIVEPQTKLTLQSNGQRYQLLKKSDSVHHIPPDAYVQHPTEALGDCGFLSFGITRKEASRLLEKHLSAIKPLIIPAIKEVLLETEFLDYLLDKKDILVIDNVEEEAENDEIIKAYIEYYIQDETRKEYLHSAFLQALAQLTDIELHQWVKDENNGLIPHTRKGYYDYSCFKPNAQHAERKDIVFVNNNHYELIEIEWTNIPMMETFVPLETSNHPNIVMQTSTSQPKKTTNPNVKHTLKLVKEATLEKLRCFLYEANDEKKTEYTLIWPDTRTLNNQTSFNFSGLSNTKNYILMGHKFLPKTKLVLPLNAAFYVFDLKTNIIIKSGHPIFLDDAHFSQLGSDTFSFKKPLSALGNLLQHPELKTSLSLRTEQVRSLKMIYAAEMQGEKDIILKLPTGSGKTAVITCVVNAKLEENPNHKLIIVTSRTELKKQIEAEFKKFSPNCPISSVSCRELTSREDSTDIFVNGQVILVTYETFYKNIEKFTNQTITLIFDEAHNGTSSERIDQLAKHRHCFDKVFHFTATPEYTDDKNLYQIHKVQKKKKKYFPVSKENEKVTNEFINTKIKQISLLDTIKTGTTPPLITSVALCAATEDDDIQYYIVNLYLEAKDPVTGFALSTLPTIIFMTTNAECNDLAEKFTQLGIKAKAVSSITKDNDLSLREFEKGNIQLLISSRMLTEGFNSKVASNIILASKSTSKLLLEQELGRGLRMNEKDPDKITYATSIQFNKARQKHFFEITSESRQNISFYAGKIDKARLSHAKKMESADYQKSMERIQKAKTRFSELNLKVNHTLDLVYEPKSELGHVIVETILARQTKKKRQKRKADTTISTTNPDMQSILSLIAELKELMQIVPKQINVYEESWATNEKKTLSRFLSHDDEKNVSPSDELSVELSNLAFQVSKELAPEKIAAKSKSEPGMGSSKKTTSHQPSLSLADAFKKLKTCYSQALQRLNDVHFKETISATDVDEKLQQFKEKFSAVETKMQTVTKIDDKKIEETVLLKDKAPKKVKKPIPSTTNELDKFISQEFLNLQQRETQTKKNSPTDSLQKKLDQTQEDNFLQALQSFEPMEFENFIIPETVATENELEKFIKKINENPKQTTLDDLHWLLDNFKTQEKMNEVVDKLSVEGMLSFFKYGAVAKFYEKFGGTQQLNLFWSACGTFRQKRKFNAFDIFINYTVNELGFMKYLNKVPHHIPFFENYWQNLPNKNLESFYRILELLRDINLQLEFISKCKKFIPNIIVNAIPFQNFLQNDTQENRNKILHTIETILKAPQSEIALKQIDKVTIVAQPSITQLNHLTTKINSNPKKTDMQDLKWLMLNLNTQDQWSLALSTLSIEGLLSFFKYGAVNCFINKPDLKESFALFFSAQTSYFKRKNSHVYYHLFDFTLSELNFVKYMPKEAEKLSFFHVYWVKLHFSCQNAESFCTILELLDDLDFQINFIAKHGSDYPLTVQSFFSKKGLLDKYLTKTSENQKSTTSPKPSFFKQNEAPPTLKKPSSTNLEIQNKMNEMVQAVITDPLEVENVIKKINSNPTKTTIADLTTLVDLITKVSKDPFSAINSNKIFAKFTPDGILSFYRCEVFNDNKVFQKLTKEKCEIFHSAVKIYFKTEITLKAYFMNFTLKQLIFLKYSNIIDKAAFFDQYWQKLPTKNLGSFYTILELLYNFQLQSQFIMKHGFFLAFMPLHDIPFEKFLVNNTETERILITTLLTNQMNLVNQPNQGFFQSQKLQVNVNSTTVQSSPSETKNTINKPK